jgi:hypothetical protein
MAYQTTGKITGMDVFQAAITIMDELSDEGKYKYDDTKEYQDRTLAILNMLQNELYPFSDTYKLNQEWGSRRRPVADRLESLYDNIDLDDYCAGTVLPYGLAAHLLLNEDPSTANYCQQRYDELKASLMRGMPAESEDITDVYGGIDVDPYNDFSRWS